MALFSKERSYAGARVLLTGGCSGLGLELTKLFAADGARVLVGDVHEQAPEGVLPAGVEYRTLDIRSDEQWEEARNWMEANWGGIDVLVNNAGIAAGGRLDVEGMDNWKRIVDINLLGAVRGIRTFVPLMKAQRSGQIINTASLAGLVHAPAMASYNAVKAGIVAISETARWELAPYKISVSAICPSFFRTNLHHSLEGKDVEMEETAVNLITKAPRGAAQVAATAYKKVKQGKFIVITDPDGQIAYFGKRYSPLVYKTLMLQAGRRVGAGKTPVPPIIDKLQSLGAKR